MKSEYVYIDEYGNCIPNNVTDVKGRLEEALCEFGGELEEENGELYTYIRLADVEPYEDDLNADEILETMKDKACAEDLEGWTPDYLEYVDTSWLQEQLSKIWKEFKYRENISSPFCTIISEQYYKCFVKETDCGYSLLRYEEE